ncbi:MAG: hypothetical protein JXJ04_20330 [Spirochaetales bacterium]|nr:hypothetical protein [Spirochaetales bacterium]
MKNTLLIIVIISCFCFIACDEVDITPEPTPVPPPGNYYGEGTDGVLNVNTSVIINNVFSQLAFAQAAGDTYIQVTDEPGFTEGDELFIYDSRGTGAGTYEFVTITQVSGTVLDIESPLEKDFPGTDLVFVYRVPHYTTVYVYDGGTITAAAWNETTGGGIVVFRATESINIIGSGKIDVSGKGYQGHNRQADGEAGFQGEGYLGIGTQNTAQNGNAGGGGGATGNGQEGAGGGGGHAFNGANGVDGTNGIGGIGGIAMSNPELTTLFFGGAGGTGADNDSGSAVNPNGGHGGGIIYISAPLLYIKNIIADGGNGKSTIQEDGGAGGGAGGSIYLLSDEVNITGDITALGGIGFTPPDNVNGGKGGDGSVGRIRIKADYIDGFTFPGYYSD